MKTAEKWENIFEKFSILEHIKKDGFYEISAKDIKEFHEPRLMAKYDFSKTRPAIFKNNNLGILPITKGKYIIGKFDLYYRIEQLKMEPKVLTLPPYIETIDPDNIYSEANALHVGYLTGMLDGVVNEHLVQSISGRMGTEDFDFNINVLGTNNTVKINASKPQIEIDGGYESENYVVLVEAKNKSTTDFIVRQLYYPYRFWMNKLSKNVIPVFFIYDSGIYTVYKYKFVEPNNYNSLQLLDVKSYVINYPQSKDKLYHVFHNARVKEEDKNIPFPQADSFTRIIELLSCLDEHELSSKEIAEKIELDDRQGNYYLDALCYLKLGKIIKRGSKKYCQLSELGKTVLTKQVHFRNIKFLELMLEHKVFYLTLKYYLENSENFPSREIIKESILKHSTVIERSRDKNNAIETADRRASTVKAWLYWATHTQI